jgi:hypothetical protein
MRTGTVGGFAIGLLLLTGVWAGGCGNDDAGVVANPADGGADATADATTNDASGDASTDATTTDATTDDAGGGNDASADASDGSTPDAASPACDPTKPFGAPTLVPGVNTAEDEYTARLSADELTVYVSANLSGVGVGGFDLYSATRTQAQGTFGSLTPLAALNGVTDDRFPTVTADGLTLYMDRDSADFYVATRASTAAAFGAPALAASLNATFFDGAPYVLDDGQTVYFYSGRGSADANSDLYRATRGVNGFDTPVAITELNNTSGGVEANDDMPAVTPDELTIFFASGRTSGGAQGQRDIWTARRANKADAFGAPTNVAELNTALEDFPTWVSADGCRLVFTSYGRTSGAAGGADVWQATRPN